MGSSQRTQFGLVPVERLRLYRRTATELRQSRLFRRGLSANLNISGQADLPVQFRFSEPDEEELRSFLLCFRKFILDKEPTFQYGIYQICMAHFTSDSLRHVIQLSRQQWKRAMRQDGISLVINGKEIQPELIADLWINGYYFHSDSRKAHLLESLLPRHWVWVRHKFLNFLVNATRQIVVLDDAVDSALSHGLLREVAYSQPS